VHLFIESDLSDKTESCYSSLSQFFYYYKVAFTKDRFVVEPTTSTFRTTYINHLTNNQ